MRVYISLTYAFAVCCTLLIGACSGGSTFGNGYSLTDEQGRHVTFPQEYSGKTLLVSYIYTHCPNVCVMTTDRMQRIRERLKGRNDVMFVSITLDPRRDTVAVLRSYAEIRGIDTHQWHFLTGDQDVLDSLFGKVGVFYRRSFMERPKKGEDVYFLDHSDIVTLVDKSGTVRAEFKGTELDVDNVVEKINEIS